MYPCEKFMKCLLKGGSVVTGKSITKKDVLFDDSTGKICKVEENISTDDAKVIDVSGKLLFPGFVDSHTHFDLEVANTVTADDFESGTKAAIIGGTTTVVDFATQRKGETLVEALAKWHKKADDKSSCDYGFHMAISDWNENTRKELKTMIEDGVTSFKLYLTYPDMFINDMELYEILKALKEVGGIAGVHCENMGLIEALRKEQKAAGNTSLEFHPLSRPNYAEAEAVSRLLKIAKVADAPVIVVHLSCRLAYEVICHAKEKGQEIYLETCPHYLLLDEGVYKEGKLSCVCSPPLRKRDDIEVLWVALEENEIQTIGADHCSFTKEQKEVGKDDFTKIPGGINGVELRPSLMYTFGVKSGRITTEQMCRVLAENPAKLYGMYPKKGALLEGSDADIVVWEDTPWKVSVNNQHSKAKYSPYENMEVQGKPAQVYLRGKLIVDDGDLISENQGVYQTREKYSRP